MEEERRTYPFEATVTPEVLDRGRHWITIRLRNVSAELPCAELRLANFRLVS